MKTVKLYDVVEKEVVVGDFDQYIKTMGVMPLSSYCGRFEDKIVFTEPETTIIPIHQWREIKNGKEHNGFIAIDPVLGNLLTIHQQEKLDKLYSLWRRSETDCMDLELRISSFNQLPWYKRIFRKV